MLIQRRFHSGIRDGSITLTFRIWQSPKVREGRRYRFGSAEDAVEIDTVKKVQLGKITAIDARRAGFETREELLDVLRRHAGARLTSRSKTYRVGFRHVRSEDPRVARRRSTSAAELDKVIARLENMDRRSGRGPWTVAALRLIDRHPQVVSSKLAPRMKREARAFKADVRKLKELGLTVSHEVGYSLSPRGKAILERLDS